MYIADYINKAQNDVLCVYLNFVMDIEMRVERLMRRQSPPKKLILMMNVGQQKNYNTKSIETFLGCDFKQGSHFTMAVVDFHNKKVTYCDSLGWSAPTDLLVKVKRFALKLYNINADFYLHYLHYPVAGYHKCLPQCHQGYPLQRDGNICRVVVVVMPAIVSLAPDIFESAVDGKMTAKHPFLEPTKFSKYLRTVVMAWLADRKIILNFVISDSIDSGDFDSENDLIFTQVESEVIVNSKIEDTDETKEGNDQA